MQPLFDITVHPTDLKEYGTNPWGQPLYRIVWSDTRLMKIRHMGKTVEMKMYDHLGAKWIMERWLPAEQVMGMSRAAFDTLVADKSLPQMAYPVRGEYEFVLVFPQEVVVGAARKTIEMIEFQRNNFTAKDRKNIAAENAIKIEMAADEARKEILGNAMTRSEAEIRILNEERQESQEAAKPYIDWAEELEQTHVNS